MMKQVGRPSNTSKQAFLVAGVLNLSTAPTSAIWRALAEQLRLEFGDLVEVARSPSARVELRCGVRNCSQLTSICALLDGLAARIFPFQRYPFMRFFYRSLFSNMTSVVLTIGAHPALCREAKKFGIPVVELEHAPGGGGQLDQYRQLSADEIPDHYVTFDDIGFEIASQMVGGKMRVIQAASPLSTAPLKKVVGRETRGRLVLVALQWGSYDPLGMATKHAPKDVIPRIVAEAVELSGDSVQWVLRPHPRQRHEKRYDYQMREIEAFAALHRNVSVDSMSDRLSEVILSFDVLVSAFSSSAFEATQLGVPAIFVEDRLGDHLGDDVTGRKISALLSSGHAVICSSTGEYLLRSIHLSRRRIHDVKQFPRVSEILTEIATRKG